MNAIPVNYRGVQMRSYTEARFARYLDQLRVRWTYEPETVWHEGRQYTPDFYVEQLDWHGRNYETVCIEVKHKAIGAVEQAKAEDRCRMFREARPGIPVAILHPTDTGTPTWMGQTWNASGGTMETGLVACYHCFRPQLTLFGTCACGRAVWMFENPFEPFPSVAEMRKQGRYVAERVAAVCFNEDVEY